MSESAADVIANTLKAAGRPLSEDQMILLAGSVAVCIEHAVAAERERCAKVCELLAWEWNHSAGHPTEALISAAGEIRGA